MRFLLLAICLMLAACSPAGGLRPTLLTSPTSYLASFPLEKITETELINKIGPPDDIIEIGGTRALVYRMGRDFGVRSYTYLISDGVVVDVLYNDGGSYNGSSATAYQNNN